MIKSKFRLGCYSYQEAVYTEWMIRYKHLGLLREKVLNGDQMLIFNNVSPYCKFDYGDLSNNTNNQKPKEIDYYPRFYDNDVIEENDINCIFYPEFSIFNIFKDDIEFFSALFENYSYYFQVSLIDELFSKTDIDEESQSSLLTPSLIKTLINKMPNSTVREFTKPISLSKLVHFSIVYDNLAMFKVLINNRYYTQTLTELLMDFKKAFQINSFKIAEFLYRESLIVTNESIDNYWSVVLNSLAQDSKKHLKIKFLQNVLKSNSPPQSLVKPQEFVKFLRKLFNFEIFTQTLESLIDSCIHLQEILRPLDSSIIQEINDFKSFKSFCDKDCRPSLNLNSVKSLDINDFKLLSIEELYEIKFKYKNKKEYSMEVGYTEKNDLNIKNLFKTILFFCGNEIKINYLFYMGKYHSTFFKNLGIQSFSMISAWFGNYSSDVNQDIKNIFKYCSKSDHKEIKKEFIKSALNDLKNPKINEKDKISTGIFFSIVLNQNDLELLKYVFETAPNLPIFSVNCYCLQFIDSVEVFDYLYNKNLIRISQILPNLIEKYEIISFIKKKYPDDYQNSFNNFDPHSHFSNYQNVRFIFDNWPDFKLKFNGDFTIFSSLPIKEYKKLINSLSPIRRIDNYDDGYLAEVPLYSAKTLEQYNYVFENKPQDLSSGRCKCDDLSSDSSINIMIHVQYLRNFFDEALSTLPINESIFFIPRSLFKEIIHRNDIKALELFLSKIKENSHYGFFLDELKELSIQFSNHFIYSFLNKQKKKQ